MVTVLIFEYTRMSFHPVKITKMLNSVTGRNGLERKFLIFSIRKSNKFQKTEDLHLHCTLLNFEHSLKNDLNYALITGPCEHIRKD
jgi:hypothetical protein